MYCSACGKEIPADARFCVHCGVQVGTVPLGTAIPPSPVAPGSAPLTGLYRSRSQRVIAGVCGGLAATYGWDISIVRLIAVLGLIFTVPVIFFAYIIAWLIVPEEPYIAPPIVTPPPAP